ncbi:Asp23/Gls24 family envelope stress response protein [Corynebacterium aquatimens]|uniref:Alkaline shock family protein YloU n=1 Tax=Corynebacterium aquatimens TaxID=1190508 RepID=A0A931GWR4_9CORY|nr:Asp23/Gls24 family envelope stress response protein [Corynebacterium aquatimens]MBG6122986.1 putative alkaline shock family protein YloU [Corynebacterium aquatimens]WJY66680.1 hypothetical protein CAQUA_09965 [Corynebacterium aquatimens]
MSTLAPTPQLDLSTYRINERTVEHVAEVAVTSVPGSIPVDAKLAGLAGRSLPRVTATIDRGDASVMLDVEMAATYPAPVRRVTDEVRRTVTSHVQTLTGLTVTRVNVAVEEVRASDRVTHFDLDQHPAGLVPARIDVSPTRVVSPEVNSSTYDNITHVLTPAPPEVRSIAVPEAPVLIDVEVPARAPLAPVSAPAPVAVRSVAAPKPRPLEPISARRVTAYSPVKPNPVALRPVETAPATHLTPIVVREFAPARPVVRPHPAPLRRVEVTRAPMIPVSVRRSAPVQPVSLPHQEPLRAITVSRPPLLPVTRPEIEIRRVVAPEPAPLTVPSAPAPEALRTIAVDGDWEPREDN